MCSSSSPGSSWTVLWKIVETTKSENLAASRNFAQIQRFGGGTIQWGISGIAFCWARTTRKAVLAQRMSETKQLMKFLAPENYLKYCVIATTPGFPFCRVQGSKQKLKSIKTWRKKMVLFKRKNVDRNSENHSNHSWWSNTLPFRSHGSHGNVLNFL